MPRAEIFSDQELQFLRELNRRRVRFLVVGLSAATLQGVPVVTQDIDLWFERVDDRRIVTALKAVGGFYIPPTPHTPPMIGGKNVKLFDLVLTMHGLRSFATEYRHAAVITVNRVRLRVLPLPRIIVSKRATNRPKDRLTLPVLEDAAKTLAERRLRQRRSGS